MLGEGFVLVKLPGGFAWRSFTTGVAATFGSQSTQLKEEY
jgi:hypothetical protein